MSLGSDEMAKIVYYAQQKIAEELFLANRIGNLDSVLKKYGLIEKIPEFFPEVSRNPKVLVCGDLGIKEKDLRGIIKHLGLDPDQFEFVPYEKVTNYNFGKLINSSGYSDILLGPVPHKAKDCQGYSSIISRIESNPEQYPKMMRITEKSGDLKISKTSFIEYLKKTRCYEMKYNDLPN